MEMHLLSLDEILPPDDVVQIVCVDVEQVDGGFVSKEEIQLGHAEHRVEVYAPVMDEQRANSPGDAQPRRIGVKCTPEHTRRRYRVLGHTWVCCAYQIWEVAERAGGRRHFGACDWPSRALQRSALHHSD
jgi:hypothetical protein